MINQTDFMQDIVKVLAATKDRAEKAAIITEHLFSELPEPVAQMVRGCVILHWFDQPFIEAMRKARLTEAVSMPNPKAYHVFRNKDIDIYEQIITLPFVEKLPWGFTLQDLTREGLLKRYAATQPGLLTSAARLAAPIYEARHNDKADAEALFCLIIEGNKVASKNLMRRLTRQARERGDEHYIHNLWEMVNEAWQIPSVEPFPLIEADFTQKEIEMLLARPTAPTMDLLQYDLVTQKESGTTSKKHLEDTIKAIYAIQTGFRFFMRQELYDNIIHAVYLLSKPDKKTIHTIIQQRAKHNLAAMHDALRSDGYNSPNND